jgi:O-antigen ligase
LTFLLAAVLAIPTFAIFMREDWVWIAATALWLAFGAVAALRALLQHPPFYGHWIGLVLLTVCLWGGAQLAAGATAHRGATAAETLFWAALAVLFTTARSLFADPAERGRFLDFALAFGGVLAAVSLLQFFTSGGRIYWWIPTEADAVLGPFRNRNHYASWMLLLFPLAMIRALRRDVLPALAAGIMAVSIVAGGSRAGIALLAIELTALFVLLRPAAAPAFALAPWRDFGNRGDLYLSTLEMIRQRPLRGYGLGAYETVYPAFARFDNGLIVDHAHNDWLEWAAEVGLIPTALLAAVAAWSLRAALRHPWALGIPAVFAHSLVDYPLHKPTISAWTVVLLGALAAAEHPTAPGGRSSAVP